MLNPGSSASSELVAEELAARCEFSKNYCWNANLLAAEKEEASGVRLSIQGDESLRKVVVSMRWGDTGVQGRRNVGKWIVPAMERAKGILMRANWEIEDSQSVYASISIKASIPTPNALQDMERTVDSLNRAMEELRFS